MHTSPRRYIHKYKPYQHLSQLLGSVLFAWLASYTAPADLGYKPRKLIHSCPCKVVHDPIGITAVLKLAVYTLYIAVSAIVCLEIRTDMRPEVAFGWHIGCVQL